MGSNPRQDVRELGSRDGIHVTGRVEDVRPYLKYARCVVAPLRIARGVQNKVLEAMSMAKPVVASDAALEGISWSDDLGIRVCEEADEWVQCLTSMVGSRSFSSVCDAARQHVSDHYSWDASARDLARIIAA